MAISRRDRSTRMLVIGLVLTSLITITLDFRGGQSGPLSGLGRAALTVITPLQEAVSRVFRPIGSFFTDVVRLGSITAENARLREEIATMRAEQEQLGEVLAENDRFRALFRLQEELEIETLGASVIGSSVTNFEWWVTINRGTEDGVEVDMPVLAPGGLAGQVVQTTGGSAKVLLITDPRSKVGVRLASTGELALLEGQGAKELRLSLIDPEVQVEPGEKVFTSGVGTDELPSKFPPRILVGEVSSVTPDETGLQAEILVRPFLDFSRLSEVLVVLSSSTTSEPQK